MYEMIPNSYNKENIKRYGLSNEEFLKLQIKYKQGLEKLLLNDINFHLVDDELTKLNFVVKPLENQYNFYHKFSILNSSFIYIRNNIHIERLKTEELTYLSSCLQNNQEIEESFLSKTLKTVIFEEGNMCFFGTPINKNLMPSKSIVFAFAYQDSLCSIEQGRIVQDIFKIAYTSIKNIVVQKLGIETSMLIDEGFSSQFCSEYQNVTDSDEIVNLFK